MINKIFLVMMFTFLSSVSWADEYILVMCKDDGVCQHVLKLYNDDLKKYDQIKYDQHNEFKVIKWKNQKSYFQLAESNGLKEYRTLKSKFDINNDGKPEIIIKGAHSIRGIDSDGLYIFREMDFNNFKDKVIINQSFADKTIGTWGYVFNKKPFEGNTYKLYDIPSPEIWEFEGNKTPIHYSLGGWFYFHPFIYKGKYFISMNDRLPDTAEKWRVPEYEGGKWEIIFEFTSDNQIKDICYFVKASNCKNIGKRGE